MLALPTLPWASAAALVPAASPFVGIAATLATRAVSLTALVALPVLILAVIRGRFFCRWGCPVGLLTECAGRLSPVSPTRCKPVPRLGRVLVLLSAGAAAVGYPLFLWLDPQAIFSGAVGLIGSTTEIAARVSAATLAGLLLLSALLPGVWCMKLCPLGAIQELLAVPKRMLAKRPVPDEKSGTDCVSIPLPRRSVLSAGLGAACAALGAGVGSFAVRSGASAKSSVLRPPGAAEAWQFNQLCLRCGNCVRACPAGIIRTQWQTDTPSAWLTPEVVFADDYCRENCTDCTAACPSTALNRTAPSDKSAVPIGLAHVVMNDCLLVQGSECQAMCMTSCPYEAITMHEWTWEDDRRYPIVAADLCPGCGACEVACRPMNAILVRPLA